MNGFGRSRLTRAAVEGGSMEPTLRAGDWLLVDRAAYDRRPPRVGEVVVTPDPRRADRVLVKRVSAIDPDGGLRLSGDHGEASTDSRTFGPVEAAALRGRAWARYWPPGRIGRLR